LKRLFHVYQGVDQYLLQFKAQLEPKPANWDDNIQGEWGGRKPGSYKWYEIQDTIAYSEEFEKPKIIFPDIAKGCKCAFDTEGIYSTNTTYFIPIDEGQKILVPILNSSLVEIFFRTISALIRGDYLRFFTQYVTQIPIRRIAFTTPVDQRTALANEGIALYKSNDQEALLTFVEACLSRQPEQSDVVHDLLVYLAEQMMNLNRQRQQASEDFMLGLESVLSDTELQKIGRLWTPPNIQQAGDGDAAKRFADVEEKLGALASQQLDLRDDIGLMNEEQWKWLLKRRLGKPDLVELTRIYRKFQPSIATLDKRIASTDHVIDEIVYRLYGLTPEEIDIVEGKQR
jgi:hypothetical protein